MAVAHLEKPTTGALLWRVTNKWRAAVDGALAPLGLTHAQYSVLASLYGLSRTGAKPSQRELADFAGLEPIYVSKLVRALARAGLLTRSGNPADPRAVQLTLTAHGQDTASRAVRVVRDLHAELTAPIGGTGSRRNQELVATLQTLLRPTHNATNDQNGSEIMAPTPTLTGQDIGEAEGATRALLDQVLVGTGVTSTEYIVLRVLTFRGPFESPATLHDFLAGQRQLRLDPPAVAALLNGLEQRGLIQGTSLDSTGPAQLTSDGAALHERLASSVTGATAELFADFEPDELATVHRVLRGVIDRAAQLRDELARG